MSAPMYKRDAGLYTHYTVPCGHFIGHTGLNYHHSISGGPIFIWSVPSCILPVLKLKISKMQCSLIFSNTNKDLKLAEKIKPISNNKKQRQNKNKKVYKIFDL
jgi:hypothetical protein